MRGFPSNISGRGAERCRLNAASVGVLRGERRQHAAQRRLRSTGHVYERLRCASVFLRSACSGRLL